LEIGGLSLLAADPIRSDRNPDPESALLPAFSPVMEEDRAAALL
jgi:hypothetical protein